MSKQQLNGTDEMMESTGMIEKPVIKCICYLNNGVIHNIVTNNYFIKEIYLNSKDLLQW